MSSERADRSETHTHYSELKTALGLDVKWATPHLTVKRVSAN
jgi:hypothetical protein